MPVEIDIVVAPEVAGDETLLRKEIESIYSRPFNHYRIIRRSIDARQKSIRINLRIGIFSLEEKITPVFTPRRFTDVSGSPRVVIIGAGPAGLFAALKLCELGIKPIILERGKDVQARRRDLAAIHKNQTVNPESNYCFGEGGAGTYSDGKLYTRSTKRGDVRSVLESLVSFGADENILVEAHPHIGTNKLPRIISAITRQIIDCGGEVHFNKRWDRITKLGRSITAVGTSDGSEYEAGAVIMATGHSARDVFSLLNDNDIEIAFKPFALGVRAEHPQHLIDKAQYRSEPRPDYLPPAAYSLVHQASGRGVYSFCMCPGGIIAPCATDPDEVVTNGWSPSKRNNPWANSGIVVPVEWDDLTDFHQYGALAGIHFQKNIEHACWQAAGSTQAAPAQRITDFISGEISQSLPDCSYQPGIVSCDLYSLLPGFISSRLREGLIAFGKKMPGYLHPDGVLVAPESRTSSPVRVPRDAALLSHPSLDNFFPCGEGAGYAGGIISAAIDGEKVSIRAAALLKEHLKR